MVSVCMETKAVFKSGGPKQSGEEVIAGIDVFCAHMDKVRKSYAYWICMWYYTVKVSLSCRWLVYAWKQRLCLSLVIQNSLVRKLQLELVYFAYTWIKRGNPTLIGSACGITLSECLCLVNG